MTKHLFGSINSRLNDLAQSAQCRAQCRRMSQKPENIDTAQNVNSSLFYRHKVVRSVVRSVRIVFRPVLPITLAHKRARSLGAARRGASQQANK